MKYLLDTDHISILQRGKGTDFVKLSARMAGLPESDFAFSIVSFQEQVLGAHSYINRAKTTAEFIRGYRFLADILNIYQTAQVLSFDASTAIEYDKLLAYRLGVGKMDLRIAAITMSSNLTLLTRNGKDFAKVPGLVIEDWTV